MPLKIALCRICEPIAFMSIFPYIYYMISSFKITRDDTQIAIYAGMVTSAFAFAEFSTGVVWGRLSDKIGRKPVLLGGLAGTGFSMMIFGFATNLPLALVGRALGGLLNGYEAFRSSHVRVFEVDRSIAGTLVSFRPQLPKWSRKRSISVRLRIHLSEHL